MSKVTNLVSRFCQFALHDVNFYLLLFHFIIHLFTRQSSLDTFHHLAMNAFSLQLLLNKKGFVKEFWLNCALITIYLPNIVYFSYHLLSQLRGIIPNYNQLELLIIIFPSTFSYCVLHCAQHDIKINWKPAASIMFLGFLALVVSDTVLDNDLVWLEYPTFLILWYPLLDRSKKCEEKLNIM